MPSSTLNSPSSHSETSSHSSLTNIRDITCMESKKKNIINLFGSIISFVFQTLWLLMLILLEVFERTLLSNGTGHERVYVFWFLRRLIMSFDGLSSVTRIAFSPPLRADCLQIMNAILDCVTTVCNIMKSGIVVKRVWTFPSLISAQTTKPDSQYDDKIMIQMIPISNR